MKTKYVFVLKTIQLIILLCTALWWQIKRRGGPLSFTNKLTLPLVFTVTNFCLGANSSGKCLKSYINFVVRQLLVNGLSLKSRKQSFHYSSQTVTSVKASSHLPLAPVLTDTPSRHRSRPQGCQLPQVCNYLYGHDRLIEQQQILCRWQHKPKIISAETPTIKARSHYSFILKMS